MSYVDWNGHVTTGCWRLVTLQVLNNYAGLSFCAIKGMVKIAKNVNSHPVTCDFIPVSYDKTANINVKKLQFNHVLTATCIDWHIENSKNDLKGDITQQHIDI